jgi:hypothetical protein
MSAMNELSNFVLSHAVRGACMCGRCADAMAHPEKGQPQGHTAHMVFFEVALVEGTKAEDLKALVAASIKGEFCDVNLFDGKEHNYMDIGGWIGDQGVALMLMGIGSLLGLWKLMTPITMLHLKPKDPMTLQLAGFGMVAIQAPKES